MIIEDYITPDYDKEHTADVTGLQRMLSPLWHPPDICLYFFYSFLSPCFLWFWFFYLSLTFWTLFVVATFFLKRLRLYTRNHGILKSFHANQSLNNKKFRVDMPWSNSTSHIRIIMKMCLKMHNKVLFDALHWNTNV